MSLIRSYSCRIDRRSRLISSSNNNGTASAAAAAAAAAASVRLRAAADLAGNQQAIGYAQRSMLCW